MTRDGAKADSNMKRKLYEQELGKLQIELCRLQEWVKAKETKIIVVFEGRDAAGRRRDHLESSIRRSRIVRSGCRSGRTRASTMIKRL
jgi:polyphosphate kinase 2 (PPK2 family)